MIHDLKSLNLKADGLYGFQLMNSDLRSIIEEEEEDNRNWISDNSWSPNAMYGGI